MEIEGVKKIKKYDAYTINEFVRSLLETKSNVKEAKMELSKKVEDVNKKLEEMDSDNISEAELSEQEKEISNIKKEKEQIDKILKKWEDERERINKKLDSKKSEYENKIKENEEKIQDLENIIKENEEKLEGLNQDSEEYADLIKNNIDLKKKISRTRGVLTRYDKKINDILEIKERLQEEPPRAVEGLKPPRTITKPKVLAPNERYKTHIEEQKTKEENLSNELKENGENKSEGTIIELSEPEIEKQIAQLEEQRRQSADRMREYKENGYEDLLAGEHAYFNEIVAKLNDLENIRKEKKSVTPEKTAVEPTANVVEHSEASEKNTKITKKTKNPINTVATEKKNEDTTNNVKDQPSQEELNELLRKQQLSKEISEKEIKRIEVDPLTVSTKYYLTNDDTERTFEGLKYEEKASKKANKILKKYLPKAKLRHVAKQLDSNIIELIIGVCGEKDASRQLQKYIDALSGKLGKDSDFKIVYNLKDIYKSELTQEEIKKVMKIAKKAEKRSNGVINVERDSLFKRMWGNIRRRISPRKLLADSKRNEAINVRKPQKSNKSFVEKVASNEAKAKEDADAKAKQNVERESKEAIK